MGLLSLNSETYKYDVILKDAKLEYYEDILKNFSDWISFKREIKLTNLLEGRRVQFDIEEIYNKGMIWGMMTPNIKEEAKIKEACFDVKSMHFIIKDDLVEKLTLGIKPLSTDMGDLLKSLIESNVEIEINQLIIDNNIKYFYIDYPKQAA
jgi:hypothetical protein